ncbi:Clp protease ClpP [Arthrobacter citreus]|nr:Clp protease ClpP [Arthrobacter citreus]
MMAKISVKGPIISNNDQWIYDWLDMDATSPKKVSEQIEKANGEDLEVEINSGGGSVFDGSEIYTSLKSYQGNVTVKIVGLAASAASVIAMAGKKIMMSPTSQMMIHNASVWANGDYRDMDHMSDVLKNVNQTVANSYKLKTGKSEEEVLSMMDKETWLTPQQALENGFIDEIMFSSEVKIVANYDSGMLPQSVIDKIKNEMMKNPTNLQNDKSDIFMQQKVSAQLNLLKLHGGMNNE